MTPNREDYIKIIYTSNLQSKKVTNKMIADKLGISAPSVSEMLSKLIESGLISKDNSLGYRLEEKGILEAQDLLRKHRLWEVFLVDYLGYDWNEVHEDAEVLEHATSNILADRLNQFLQNPETCPHGSEIYGNSKSKVHYVPLGEVSLNETIRIGKVHDHPDLLDYLGHKEIHIGNTYEVTYISPYDNSLTLKSSEQSIEISEMAAKEIFIERI